MTSTPLAEAASQFTLEDVVAHGQRQGRTPEQIATAVKRWRDGAREFGEAKLKASDPLKWFRGNAKLDSRIRDELDGVKVIAATEMIASTIRDESDRSEFVRQYEAFNGDPSKFAEGSGARSLAEKLQGIDRSDAFNLPDASDRVAPLATEAGVILGDFETQTRPGNGGLDILIRLDDKDEGSKRKSITIPEVTDEEIASARSKAEDEAKRLRQIERTTRRALEDDLAEEPVQRGYDLGYQADLKHRRGVGEREIENARIEAEAAEARASSLADPDRGRLVLLRERVEDQVNSDKDLKKIAGDVALGEDFWRGVQQTHLGARLAIADAKGDEEEKTKLRGLIGELAQIYPGSTNYQFRGGAGAFVSDVSTVMGGMLPTMLVSSVTGGVGAATGTAVGGVTRAAALAPISLSAYGNAYATMLNEADSLEQQGRVEEAEERRRDARTYAMLSAAVETGSEFIFKEEMFQVGGRGLLQKVAKGAAQNTAEELVASVGNAELNREFRDELTPVSQIAYESALGTAVGGLMQVPGGVVEVFLPKAKPTPQAPPSAEEPTTGETGTPPPSSPPPTEEPGTPPPTEESAPPPEDPGAPPPSEGAVFKIGEQMFTWSGSEWTNQDTGQTVDPQTEPGLVLQLGEARRQLEAGETPVPQEVNLTPDETPMIFTIDGQRSFMPAPDGKGWLEVFPQTGEESRPANFASEGEIGIAILRRLQAKMTEKQAAAALPPAQETPAEEMVETEETAPEQPQSQEDPVEEEGPSETTSFDPAKVPIVEFPVADIVLSTDVPNFKEDADPVTGVVAGRELGGKFERLGTPPIVVWERLDGRKEIITGRHRLDLARRSGEETIPTQIVREADGFTREKALVFDAASNIRDGQGSIRDYADFFRNSPSITEASAESGGLLSRAKGRAGWHLGKSATDDLYALYRAGKITEARAVTIAETAPGNADAQRIGVRYALEKKDTAFIANVMKASGAESAQRGETIDLFGKDDAAMMEMERRAARAGQFQRAIQDQITAAQSAAKRPEAAKKMGIDVSDPEAVQARIATLKTDVARWQNWPMHRDLVELVKGDGPVTAETASPSSQEPAQPARPETEGQLLPEAEMPFNLAGDVITEAEPVEPEDTRTDAEKDADSGQERLFDDRITPLTPERNPDAIDAEIEELLRAKRARFSGRRSSGMRDILDQYYTAESFERAFAKHVADGDFQKAYEAVRDSDDSVTIPTLKKWMKAVRTGDPVAQKNLEWIRAIFNGTVPPGVSQQPPPSGPAPSSGTATPPPQQQAPPPPPPPAAPKSPPPRPDGVEKLNIPALVFLARKMGTTPLVRKFRARGSFRPSNNRGEPQESPIIRVNEFLGKEDWQGAARTLAHEIGHFIDYIVNAVPYADIVKRLIPLESVRDQFIEDIFGQGTKYSEARNYMMEEAIALSKIMRGDFDDNDAYRKSSVELYADFMSAVMIDPELAFDTAPLMSHAWFAHLDQKPTALAAWNLVQNLIKGDGLFEAIRQDRVEDQTAAMSSVAARADRIARRDRWWNMIDTGLIGAFWSRYVPAGAKKVTDPGWKNHFRFTARWWEAATNPKEGDFVAKMEGAEIEASQRGSALRLRMQRDVYDPLRRHGISNVQLDEYLTFFQILNEDTATRQYLQENPEEFREFLLWLDDAAGLGRASEIEGASDADLDLIGAGMVGTIQLHEQLEMIYSMAQSADAPDIAARGLFAFDIARYQWNQEGHTPETAQQGMDYLQRELGDERFDVLRAASRAFHQNLAGIVREANSVGLFGDRIWSEKIKPNIGNYVPRMVLDYFTGEMSASIKQRRGSVKGTLPKYLAGEGQAMVLLHKIAKQKQVLFILEQASDFGWSNEIQPLTIPRGKNPDTVAKQLRKEEGKAIRGYYVRGKWSWLSFDDPAVVQWLDGADAGALKWALDIAKANENTWRLWTTVLKASFALWNNPVRTIKTGLSDFGYRSPQWAAHAVRQFPEALAWARASLGMEAPTERVLDLVERGVLPAFGQYSAADLRISNEDLVAQIAEGLTGIEALRRGRIAQDPVSRAVQNALNAPGVRQLVRWLSLFTGTFEVLPKLATDSFWESRGLSEWERDRLSRMEGIPNTGLSAGKFGSWAGTVSLFYRVWVQGMRRMMTLPVNPRTRGMWWTGRLADFAMKGFYAAAAAGIIDALLGGDDEEKQVDWQEAFTRVSNFKLTNGDVLFFGWTLPDGSYEPPWGHSVIPSNWTPLLLRLPVSESGRISEPLAMMTIGRLFPDNPLAPSTPSDRARRLRDLRASLSPSLNPIFENGVYAMSLGDPKSPRDPYSGRDVVPQDEWDSGMNARRWGIAKHLLEDTPLGNFSPALRSGIQNERELPTWLRAVSSIPGASAALATDNSQLAADYMDRIEERDSVNRKARLLRGPKTKAAVSLRSRLSRIPAESRTPTEQEKIEILNHWYRTAYMGNSSFPGLYRELQAHAAGMEGVDEKDAREALEETAVEVLREIGAVGR